MSADDLTILDEQLLLRRIHPQWIANGEPESSNFDAKRSDDGLSVTLWVDESSIAYLLAGHEDFGISVLTAGDLRQEGFIIERAPMPDNPHHCDAVGPVAQKSSKRLRQKHRWLKKPGEAILDL
ncbi:hypothetical protein [Sphingorhabdus sp.]|uniref:hypothetical protein n=1 Tax=Sphingorhabdus sp. TaxID=1902408 RepID=UPI0032B78BF7